MCYVVKIPIGQVGLNLGFKCEQLTTNREYMKSSRAEHVLAES